jgi:catechol 2,3-dioxygenase-like lactoylglutathione lyase family enzyme
MNGKPMSTAMHSDDRLDAMHHVAIAVEDIDTAVRWYQGHFRCKVAYQDPSWALLKFSNMQLALVIPSEHPPHIAFEHTHPENFGPLKTHRDGTRSTYIADSAGNPVEILAKD